MRYSWLDKIHFCVCGNVMYIYIYQSSSDADRIKSKLWKFVKEYHECLRFARTKGHLKNKVMKNYFTSKWIFSGLAVMQHTCITSVEFTITESELHSQKSNLKQMFSACFILYSFLFDIHEFLLCKLCKWF